MSTEEKYNPDLFIEPPNYELICPICLFVMKEPKQLSGCEHMFCKSCIQTHFRPSSTRLCPVDKKTARVTEIVSAPRAIVNIISQLEMKCFYHNKGCSQIIRVGDHYKHTDNCRFKSLTYFQQIFSRLSVADSLSSVDQHFNMLVKLRSGKTLVLSTCGSDTVQDLKHKIHEKEGIDPKLLQLYFKGKIIEDNKILSSYGVKNTDLLYTFERLKGGH